MKRLVLCLVATWVCAGSAHALDYKWRGANPSVPGATWSSAGNWSPNGVPDAEDNVNFSDNWGGIKQTNTLDADSTILNLTYAGSSQWTTTNSGAYTLTVLGNMTNALYTGSYQSLFWPRLDLRGRLYSDIRAGNTPGNNPPALMAFMADGNVIGGGIESCSGPLVFLGNNNVVNNGITVTGYSDEIFIAATAYKQAGAVVFGGTGNTFNGTFTLNPGGCIVVTNGADFSGVSDIVWNGGHLRLIGTAAQPSSTFPTYTKGFEVKRGTLAVSSDSMLGTRENAIRLGSENYYGVLRGAAPNTDAGRINREIVLEGRGGVLKPESAGGNSHLYIEGKVSGPGELIVQTMTAGHWAYLANGGRSAFDADTWTGGTRIASFMAGLSVQSFRSLGTGDVWLENGGRLLLVSSNAVAEGASVSVGQTGIGGTYFPSVLRVAGDFLPTIDGNSSGLISLDVNSGANINARLQSQLGNGEMWLGASAANVTVSATDIAAGVDGIYRIAGGYNAAYTMTFSGANAFTGDNNMEISLREGNSYSSTSWRGQVSITGTNDFTGSIRINPGGLLTVLGTAAEGTSGLGSAEGSVTLLNSTLRAQTRAAGTWQPVSKGVLNVEGTGTLQAYSTVATATQEMRFASFTRTHNATLTIQGIGGNLGTRERVKILSGVPDMVNGMVAPYMLGPSSFLTYDPDFGFSNAAYTVTGLPTGLTAGTDIANVTDTTTLTDNPYVHALRMSKAILKSGQNDTITIGSGGLIVNDKGHTSDVDLIFGTVSDGVTTLTEAVVYTDGTTGRWAGPRLSGRVHAAGFTKTGPGFLELHGYDNYETITGPIYINEGTLSFSDWSQLNAEDQPIIINGGALYNDNTTTGNPFFTNKVFKIGPASGGIGDAHDGCHYYGGSFEELVPGSGATLSLVGHHYFQPDGTPEAWGPTITVENLLLRGSTQLRVQAVPRMTNTNIRIESGTLMFFPNAPFYTQGRLSLNEPTAYVGVYKHVVSFGSLDGNGRIICLAIPTPRPRI